MQEFQLGDLLEDIVGGGTPSKRNDDYWDGGTIPWASVKDMPEGKYRLKDTEDHITEEGLKNSSSNLIPKGTVITSTRMGLGRSFINEVDIAINQDLKALFPNGKLHNEFLLWWLASKANELESIGTGTTVKGIRLEQLRALNVNLPDLPIQKKIASILSAFDDLIENNTRRIEILEEMARRIYREWFLHFRYPGHEDDELVPSDTELGKIPEGWEVKKLEDFGEIVLGKTPSTKDSANYGNYMPFIKTPDMHDQFFIHETENVLSKKGVETQKKKTLPADSICVSCIGTAGVVAITSVRSQTNQQINSIVPEDKALREYLYFTTKALKPLMEKIGSTGATMTNVSKTKFKGLPALSAPEEVINKFHAKVGPLFDQISTLQKQNDRLKETRDLLLPKLISGKIDVEEFKYKLTEDALG